ncbi:oligosaccharide flippase family protein [uncultured Alcanivorax sp.]|uniref:oligosaccharide flippase family protein n=1 Tax=uncultured Alcanivorax sp. TaxID=191215 RepID=UPI002620CEAA|nr:oligosaccharide flippase family protein [uncultured Alcanivorax sp.]
MISFSNKSLKASSVGSLVIQVTNLFLALAVSVLLASDLGAEKYGVYVVVLSTVMLVSIPITLGFPMLLVRFIPQYELEENYAAINGLVVRSNQFVIAGSAIIGVTLCVLYFTAKDSLDYELWRTIFWGALLLPALGLNALRSALLEGFRLVVIGQIPDLVIRQVVFIVLITVFTLLNGLNPSDAMMLHFASASISFFIGLAISIKKLGPALRGKGICFEGREWLQKGASFSLNMGVNNIKSRLAIYILAVVEGAAAVGIFEVAIRAAGFVSFSLAAVNKALGPHISRSYHERKFGQLQSVMKKSARAVFLLALPVVMIYLIFGEWLLSFFYGDEYLATYAPLVILSLGQLVNSYFGSVGLLLNMSNSQGYVVKVNVINTAVNFVFSLILTSIFSLVGAALAYVLLLLIQNVVFWLYAKKQLGVNTLAF